MKSIDRQKLKQMIDAGEVTVVETLDEKYFKKFHLPGAINVPLSDSFDEDIQKAVPDKSAPVAVYCMDEECHASPKAGRRMEQLGYEDVRHYAGGKTDWQEAGLPVETSQ